jgi:hypothetical protein
LSFIRQLRAHWIKKDSCYHKMVWLHVHSGRLLSELFCFSLIMYSIHFNRLDIMNSVRNMNCFSQ